MKQQPFAQCSAPRLESLTLTLAAVRCRLRCRRRSCRIELKSGKLNLKAVWSADCERPSVERQETRDLQQQPPKTCWGLLHPPFWRAQARLSFSTHMYLNIYTYINIYLVIYTYIYKLYVALSIALFGAVLWKFRVAWPGLWACICICILYNGHVSLAFTAHSFVSTLAQDEPSPWPGRVYFGFGSFNNDNS